MAISTAYNIPLEIKRIFLKFAQAYFENIPEFAWTYDIQETKIIIADRNATDIGVAVRRPSIILTRSDIGWSFAVRGQSGYNVGNWKRDGLKPLSGSEATLDRINDKVYTDLLNANVVLNVLSKNGVQAESIANYLFTALTAYKDEFKQNGIFKFTGMSMGAERIIKQDSEITLTGVPISISFQMQQTVTKDIKAHNLIVTSNSVPVYENTDFIVITNGTQLEFHVTPEEDIVATYTDAITLDRVTDATLVATADPKIWTIPDSGTILGYYEMLAAFELTLTADSEANDYNTIEDQEVHV